MEQKNKLREDYLLNGFVVVKSVFNMEIIASLRKKMIDLANFDQELLLDEDVQKLLLNEELIKNIKYILNTDNLLYYSDSAIINHTDPFKSRNGYHIDARGEDVKIPYEDEYPIIRMGIYFEDYKNFSGGLKIKEKSHKYFCFNFRTIKHDLKKLIKIFFTKTRYNLSSLKLGKSVNLELTQGDVVIWNLRAHHCGTSRRLKLFPKLCLQPHLEKILPHFFYIPTQYKKDRCAIFSTFSKNDLKNKNILGYLNIKTNVEKLNQIKSNPDLLNKLNKLGVELPPNF